MIDIKILPDGVNYPQPVDGLAPFLNHIGTDKKYHIRQILFKPFSIPDHFYMVKRGRVFATVRHPSGAKLVLGVFEKGEVFGLTSMLTGRCCGVTYITGSEAVLRKIGYSEFNRLMCTTPDIILPLIENIVVSSETAATRLLGHFHYSVEVRVANTLLDMAARLGVSENGKINLYEKPTQENFADLVGSHRITINKCINKMRREGLIDINNNAYIIPDVKKLAEWRDARITDKNSHGKQW